MALGKFPGTETLLQPPLECAPVAGNKPGILMVGLGTGRGWVLPVLPGYLWSAVGQRGSSASGAWLAVSSDDGGDGCVSPVLQQASLAFLQSHQKRKLLFVRLCLPANKGKRNRGLNCQD